MYVPNNPISNLKPRHSFAHAMNGAGYVAAKYGRVLLHEDAEVLHVRVEGVDCYSGVLHHDLAWAWGGEVSRADAEGSPGGVEEGC